MLPEQIKRLHKLLEGELPGRDAQWQMAHVSRSAMPSDIRSDVRTAAVLILFYLREKQWHTVFIKRKMIKGDRHGGQISFPGGRQEPDESLFETAVRECHEEIGAPRNIAHVGRLTRLHIPVSNYLVHPFIGYLSEEVRFVPQESEVDQILEVPVQTLFDAAIRRTTNITLHNGIVLQDVPCFIVMGHIVWGATAMILNELLTVADDDLLAAL